jgi:hypothetical protein
MFTSASAEQMSSVERFAIQNYTMRMLPAGYQLAIPHLNHQHKTEGRLAEWEAFGSGTKEVKEFDSRVGTMRKELHTASQGHAFSVCLSRDCNLRVRFHMYLYGLLCSVWFTVVFGCEFS